MTLLYANKNKWLGEDYYSLNVFYKVRICLSETTNCYLPVQRKKLSFGSENSPLISISVQELTYPFQFL